jgi:nitrate/TMAO reductase-like tetraheme cytochrome c subunit
MENHAMPTQTPAPAGKRSRWLWPLIAIAALAIIVTVSGFGYAATQEEHDPFCASCHTEPESTYVQRAATAPPVDLASFHTTQNTRCIDCHSGLGIPGRMQAELLGARNSALWYTHMAKQPATVTQPIGDANCLKCHQDVTQRGYTPKQAVTIGRGGREGREGGEAGNNHWHEQLSRWQATAADAATCISCHPSHSTAGTAATGFQDMQVTRSECDACHQVLRHEE